MDDTATTPVAQRAKPSGIREFFQSGGYPPVTLQEIKALKEKPKDYDDIAEGIGNKSLTY